MSTNVPVGANYERGEETPPPAEVEAAPVRRQQGSLLVVITAMIVIQFLLTINGILYKRSSEVLAPLRVMTAYGYLMALTAISPIMFCKERDKWTDILPHWRMILGLGCCCGVLRCGGEILMIMSLNLKNVDASIMSTVSNLSSVLTYILTLIFRLEKLEFGWATPAKVAGTIISAIGVTIFAFVKKPKIALPQGPYDWSQGDGHPNPLELHHNPVEGIGLVLGSCVLVSLQLIAFSHMVRTLRCPPLSSTFLLFLFTGISATFVAAVVDGHDKSRWLLHPDITMFTCFYSGFITSGLSMAVVAWAVEKRDVLVVAVFSPLGLLFTSIIGYLFLGEHITFGSIQGGLLIIAGVMAVLWGQHRQLLEMNNRETNEAPPLPQPTDTTIP